MRYMISCLLAAMLLTGTICLAGQEISADLGKQDLGFGTAKQAEALLQLIDSNPGGDLYKITYRTDIDAVVLGCSLQKDTVLRIHSDLDGHGTSEEWSGHSLYRIKDAAAGGSLNNTPEGKSFGAMEKF